MDRPGIIMPDAALIIGLLVLGLFVVVLFTATAINRWMGRQD